MKSVKIATFKSELAKYLRFVRRGEQITILDRVHPIAIISPIPASLLNDDIQMEEPTKEAKFFFKLQGKPKKNKAFDSLQSLLEDRKK